MRILYLDLDTLRPDHLGCYGYLRDTSPHLDRIAAEGVRFGNVYCSDAPCLPSRTALMTGRFGIHTGVVNHGGLCADPRPEGRDRRFRTELSRDSLPASLKAAGYHTTYVGGFGERHSAWSYYAGFREIHDTGRGGMESAEDVTPTVLDWLRRNGARDRWYLHVNYWDAHTPYRAPADFGQPFAGAPLPALYTEELLARHRRLPGPHTAQDLSMYDNREDPRYPRQPGELKTLDDVRRLVDGYDTGIRYLDSHVGAILAALESAGVLDDTAILVSSDHGENMGELGIYAEHATADHGTCRIPLIVRWPGGRRGAVDRGLHYNLDLAPSLADLLGFGSRPTWEGASFAPAVLEGRDIGRDDLVISQCAHVCQRGVRWRNYLYVRTWHDGYHLFPPEMAFDVEADPFEQEDLAPRRSDLCREGAHRLARWHDTMMSSQPAGYGEDPMWTVIREGGPAHARGFLRRYCERLAATGRGECVEELRRRHPREFADPR